MIDVVVCCGATQARAAEGLRARLEQTAEARIRVDVCDEGQTVLDLWDEGMAGAAIVLLLSADAVPEKAGRARWEDLLQHAAGRQEPALGVVVMEPCGYPGLLSRASFFRLDDGLGGWRRELQAWLVGRHGQAEGPRFEPAALTVEAGEEDVLEELARRLIDGSGTVEVGEPALAQKFARRALPYFREVFWLSCAGRSTACLAGELAWLFGVVLEGTEAEAWRRLGEFVAEHRVLVVVDEAPAGVPELAGEHGRGCVVRTAAQESISPPDAVRQARAEKLNEIFLQWRDVERCRGFAAELEAALEWARANDWALAVSLTNRAGNFFKQNERRFEAAHFYSKLREEAVARGDGKVAADCDWELSWLLNQADEVRAAWAGQEQMPLF